MSQATLQPQAPASPSERSGARASRCPSLRSSWRCCRRSWIRRSWPPRCPSSPPISAASPTSRGSSPPTSSPPRRPRRCGASSATATAASCCSRSRSLVFVAHLGAVRRGAGHHAAHRPARRPGRAAGGLMTLAMAAVGDLVAPRERGRYQGYIAATFAVATIVGPLIGGVLVDHASWRWVFLVNLPVGAAALAGLHLRLPAPQAAGADRPLDVAGRRAAGRRDHGPPAHLHLGRRRYAWDSAAILALIATTVVLTGALFVRERRAADPIVPFHLLRTRPVAIASAALFLGDRRAVLGHRLRPALPGDDDRARARPTPACCSSRPCSASPSRRRSPAGRSCAPGATSASRSPAWLS